MKIRNADAEEFRYLLDEIRRGANLDTEDILTACRYATATFERYQLLNALVNGYAAHQQRIGELNTKLVEAQIKLRLVRQEAGNG